MAAMPMLLGGDMGPLKPPLKPLLPLLPPSELEIPPAGPFPLLLLPLLELPVPPELKPVPGEPALPAGPLTPPTADEEPFEEVLPLLDFDDDFCCCCCCCACSCSCCSRLCLVRRF